MTVSVPYCRKHVEKYHDWMKSQELQRLTGSEPLTLEEEYDMQLSWKNSEDKCTFIVLSKAIYEDTNDEIEAMVGDTNLFLTHDQEDQPLAEAEIMIADQKSRGHGFGREAVTIMLNYGLNQLGVKRFQAKIKMDNDISIRLFQNLGFRKVNESQVFQEVTLESPAESGIWTEFCKNIAKTCQNNTVSEYIHDI